MWSVNIHDCREAILQGDAQETITCECSIDCIKGVPICYSIISSMFPLGSFDFSIARSGSRVTRFVDCHQLRGDHELFNTLFPASTCLVDESTCIWYPWYQTFRLWLWRIGGMGDIEFGCETIQNFQVLYHLVEVRLYFRVVMCHGRGIVDPYMRADVIR